MYNILYVYNDTYYLLSSSSSFGVVIVGGVISVGVPVTGYSVTTLWCPT